MIDSGKRSDNFKWLYDDVQQSKDLIEKEDSQFARRSYLRALSAWYELTLSALREEAVILLINRFELNGKINLHEISPLLDETAALSNNGKLRLTPNRQPFLPLVAYTLKTFAMLIEYPGSVLSDHRWQSFCVTIKIRHRITHPKFHSEIEISDDELKTISEGEAWWDEALSILWEYNFRYLSKPKTITR